MSALGHVVECANGLWVDDECFLHERERSLKIVRAVVSFGKESDHFCVGHIVKFVKAIFVLSRFG